jgi:hypothetical protein
MITNIDIDEELVAEAMKVSGARTKREVVDRALREMVARARRPRFRDFYGIGGIDPAYDPKASSPEDAGKNRVEQPRASYKLAAPAPAPAAPAKTPGRKAPRKS